MTQPRLTVAEASEAYANAMRNPAPAGGTVCPRCRTFHDPAFPFCVACAKQPNHLSAFVPITYSVDSSQMHAALRRYKDDADPQARRFHAVRLAAILWRFLERHEACLLRASGVDAFEFVTTVPSKTKESDERRTQLRTIVGSWCAPTAGRFKRLLYPTDRAGEDHTYLEAMYESRAALAGRTVLLIDDTWTTGGTMQSAAAALLRAGASGVGGLAIGRHLRLDFEWASGSTHEEYDRLPRAFSWEVCVAAAAPR